MSNAHPGRFLELVAEADGPILDCGAGGRRLTGVLSFEYVPHPNNDVQGDVLALPFRDDTFSLILSQAVLEHVTDPQQAVDEMVRCLAPGGLLFAEAAFMQPVHMAPMHYCNITPFGLAHLCRELDVVESGAFGLVAEWWQWIAREGGFAVHLGAGGVDKITKALRSVDRHIDAEHLARIASGVYVLGRKR